jgi:signal transduction histidine kinase
LLARRAEKGVAAGSRLENFEAGALQVEGQEAPNVLLVFDHQYSHAHLIAIPSAPVNVSFRTKLLASYVAVALLVSAVTFLIVDRVVTRRLEVQGDQRLEDQAHGVLAWLQRAGHPDQLSKRLAQVVGARVTFLSASGELLGDSRASDAGEQDGGESNAPEVLRARSGHTGYSTRYADWARQRVRYVAIPGPDDTVVRLGEPIGEITAAKEEIRGLIAVGALIASLFALVLAVLIARPLSQRLSATTEMARRIGKGDWEVEVGDEPDDEIGLLQKTLVSAADDLKAADDRRREFLSNIAHEIRTPVTSIAGFAETLATGGVPDETRREFLETIQRNSQRIGKLVEDLLELEALETGTGRPLDRDRVPLASVVSQARSTLEMRARELGASIEVELADDLEVIGDAEAVERIALNLISNSLSHGGDGVAVRVTSELDGDRVVLVFVDDGPGVSSEQAARVFDRFYRGAPGRSRDQGGSGLGLAIARQLAQSMSGSLYLRERDEPGMSLCLELPRAK